MSVTLNIVKKSKPDDKGGMTMLDKLNKAIATYSVASQNFRALHWLIQGPHFFGLHAQYGDLYDTYSEYVDLVAERIKMLDETPIQTLSEFAKLSKLKEVKDVSMCMDGVEIVVADIDSMIMCAEGIIADAESAKDVGTADMFIKIIGEQQKSRWMFKSILDGKKAMEKK